MRPEAEAPLIEILGVTRLPNNEVFSNADASLDQFIMEGCLIIRNPAGVGMLNNITNTGSLVTTPRASATVQRVNSGAGDTY